MKQTSFAHMLWLDHLRHQEQVIVIDATLGRGQDALFCAMLPSVIVIHGIDIQNQAIQSARSKFSNANNHKLKSHRMCHQHIDQLNVKPDLIIYNLGYLPGGDKSICTNSLITLTSVEKACHMLNVNGALSMMVYPGHEQGNDERDDLVSFFTSLSKDHFWVQHIRTCNRLLCPELFWCIKKQ